MTVFSTRKDALKMSRKPAPPKPEELIAKLDEKFEAFKEDIAKSLDEKGERIEELKLKETELNAVIEKNKEESYSGLENMKISIEDSVERKVEDIRRELLRSVDDLTVKISAASSGSSGTEARIQDLVDRVESIQERMYDFEVNKRNNLLFYNIREDKRETPSDLYNKASEMDNEY